MKIKKILIELILESSLFRPAQAQPLLISLQNRILYLAFSRHIASRNGNQGKYQSHEPNNLR